MNIALPSRETTAQHHDTVVELSDRPASPSKSVAEAGMRITPNVLQWRDKVYPISEIAEVGIAVKRPANTAIICAVVFEVPGLFAIPDKPWLALGLLLCSTTLAVRHFRAKPKYYLRWRSSSAGYEMAELRDEALVW